MGLFSKMIDRRIAAYQRDLIETRVLGGVKYILIKAAEGVEQEFACPLQGLGNDLKEKQQKKSADDQNAESGHINSLLIPDTCNFYGIALY